MPNHEKFLEKLNQATPSQVDLRLSWYMFKRNVRAYTMIAIFSVASSLLIMFIVGFLVGILSVLIGGESIVENQLFMDIMIIIITIPLILFFYAFFGSGYGLAYDIMSSGDEFAQFKGAFSYFKRFWWQYIVISLVSALPTFLINPFFLPLNGINHLWIRIIIHGLLITITYFWSIIVGIAFPIVTAKNSIKKSLILPFTLLSKYPKRYLSTWLKFFVIFYIPSAALTLIYFFSEFYEIQMTWWINLFMAFSSIVSLFIAFPMQTLVATRFYNSLEPALKDDNSD